MIIPLLYIAYDFPPVTRPQTQQAQVRHRVLVFLIKFPVVIHFIATLVMWPRIERLPKDWHPGEQQSAFFHKADNYKGCLKLNMADREDQNHCPATSRAVEGKAEEWRGGRRALGMAEKVRT